jgi:hypothetical protein
MLGDVNISAILDSFSASYDKRVRPNYGGKLNYHSIQNIFYFRRELYGIESYNETPSMQDCIQWFCGPH